MIVALTELFFFFFFIFVVHFLLVHVASASRLDLYLCNVLLKTKKKVLSLFCLPCLNLSRIFTTRLGEERVLSVCIQFALPFGPPVTTFSYSIKQNSQHMT